MHRLSRPPSKLLAVLPDTEPPPGFEELEYNLDRSGLAATLRSKPPSQRYRALVRKPGGALGCDVELTLREPSSQYLELARLGVIDSPAAMTSRFCVSVTCT